MITIIDMHIRDERLFQFLINQGGHTSTREICEKFCCHANTARAMLKRLELARKIRITKKSHRWGFDYEVL